MKHTEDPMNDIEKLKAENAALQARVKELEFWIADETLREKFRAEGMMDASWLIWDTVIPKGRGLEIVRQCREAIENKAKKR